ncbi:MAG: M15 family metallopeptidase [Promicromonosporaceae bacterium]|nr:M15 family metallopeptidase [Promicromonosporaceae bacterium]
MALLGVGLPAAHANAFPADQISSTFSVTAHQAPVTLSRVLGVLSQAQSGIERGERGADVSTAALQLALVLSTYAEQNPGLPGIEALDAALHGEFDEPVSEPPAIEPPRILDILLPHTGLSEFALPLITLASNLIQGNGTPDDGAVLDAETISDDDAEAVAVDEVLADDDAAPAHDDVAISDDDETSTDGEPTDIDAEIDRLLEGKIGDVDDDESWFSAEESVEETDEFPEENLNYLTIGTREIDLGNVTWNDVTHAAVSLAALLAPDTAQGISFTIELPGLVEEPELADTHGQSMAELLAHLIAQFGDSTDGYANGHLPESVLCPISFNAGHRIRCDATGALTHLNEAFKAEFGHDLPITSSYRTFAGQVQLALSRPRLAATPGTSMHGWGLAVDFGGRIASASSAEYQWLLANAPYFGWENPRWAQQGGSKPEPWHFEFMAVSRPRNPVSVPVATPPQDSGASDPIVINYPSDSWNGDESHWNDAPSQGDYFGNSDWEVGGDGQLGNDGWEGGFDDDPQSDWWSDSDWE